MKYTLSIAFSIVAVICSAQIVGSSFYTPKIIDTAKIVTLQDTNTKKIYGMAGLYDPAGIQWNAHQVDYEHYRTIYIKCRTTILFVDGKRKVINNVKRNSYSFSTNTLSVTTETGKKYTFPLNTIKEINDDFISDSQ